MRSNVSPPLAGGESQMQLMGNSVRQERMLSVAGLKSPPIASLHEGRVDPLCINRNILDQGLASSYCNLFAKAKPP